MTDSRIDIQENAILALSPALLSVLLTDRTLSTADQPVNIFWATDNYASRGDGYQYADRITVERITGENGMVIVPRALKSRQQQQQRSREMAEVFTPSWICNVQNNLVDSAWFGREGVFNTEVDLPGGIHTWEVNPEPVSFPKGKTWRDYVRDNRLEITCGEAPYLASRHDTVTGEAIAVERRIGMLDRKLRVVGENTATEAAWLKAAREAFQSTYGYEWQGDNLVLARESLLWTFVDFFRAKFGKDPHLRSMLSIAEIISWNIFQMDGLKCVIPCSCRDMRIEEYDIFSNKKETIIRCEGCRTGDYHRHNGTYVLIRDWQAPKDKQKIRFVDLIKNKKK